MRNKAIDKFVGQASNATGLDVKLINRQNAEYLWRLINRHGIVVPREIDEGVFKYLRGGYAQQRRHTLTGAMEAWSGATLLEGLLGREDVDYALATFLNDPKIREYLTKR